MIYATGVPDCDSSLRAAELAQFFGCPYGFRRVHGVRSLFESYRIGPADLPIGCLNQDWSGPALVWYPAGNWMLPPAETLEKEHEEV
jgi:hypothetical protein